MAKRSRESFGKRAREKARLEKQAEKREKRQSSSSDDDEKVTKAKETALMEEFATLSARFEAEQISPDEFSEQRQRIFEELGLETE